MPHHRIGLLCLALLTGGCAEELNVRKFQTEFHPAGPNEPAQVSLRFTVVGKHLDTAQALLEARAQVQAERLRCLDPGKAVVLSEATEAGEPVKDKKPPGGEAEGEDPKPKTEVLTTVAGWFPCHPVTNVVQR